MMVLSQIMNFGWMRQNMDEIINFRFISNFIRATNTIFFYCGLTLVMQLLYKKNIKKENKQFIYNLCHCLLRPEYLKYCNIDLLFELDLVANDCRSNKTN